MLIAIVGMLVTALVVVGMIYMTPGNTETVAEHEGNLSRAPVEELVG